MTEREKFEELLAKLDSIGRDVDHYEFGLPIYNEEQHGMERMMEVVSEFWQAATLAERERCAQVCQNYGEDPGSHLAEVIRKGGA